MLLHKWFSLLEYFSEEAFPTGFNSLGKFLSKFFFFSHLFLVSLLFWQHSLSWGSLGNRWRPQFFCLQCYQVNARTRGMIYRYFWSDLDFENFPNNSLGRRNPFFAHSNGWRCWRWGDCDGLAFISTGTTTYSDWYKKKWTEQIKIIVFKLSFYATTTRALDLFSLHFMQPRKESPSMFSKILYLLLTTFLSQGVYISIIYPVHFKTLFQFVILDISDMSISGYFFTKNC